MAPPSPAPSLRRRGRASVLPALVAIAVLIVVAVSVGSWVQYTERQTNDTVRTVGSTAADRVDVEATVQSVDAAARELVLRMRVTPRGTLGEEGGSAPVADLSLQTSVATLSDLTFPAHERITPKDVQIALTGGSISDYPFDTYETDIEVWATQGGRQVPVRMLFSNNATLFSISTTSPASAQEAVVRLRLSRSGSLLVFAVFMMVVMWALAASVLLGAWYLTTRGEGLVWPALAWMAATLFALAAFRNTAPGSPPIGCVLDWFAFLWAETVIALCLITVVLTGVRSALRAALRTDDAPGT
ncbi:DUF4436 family protein [Streptomyces asoensis]|uniref:DUF4436 domain-containing protein n=1 Tax=Streptomyces asoensis TaxID=249586 RepID=A0ABQ3RXX8_9ACTN|nr:DUF4436 family protein [Streptomyces asoensis]GGQ54254.1 hypothetical protein GCM10010496_16350 [Streptomyces asoensis]GHI60726.1 hypothetical protein Saso_23760 [Streptomyces asoensis]